MKPGIIMFPAFIFHGIAYCVTHLYVQKSSRRLTVDCRQKYKRTSVRRNRCFIYVLQLSTKKSPLKNMSGDLLFNLVFYFLGVSFGKVPESGPIIPVSGVKAGLFGPNVFSI